LHCHANKRIESKLQSLAIELFRDCRQDLQVFSKKRAQQSDSDLSELHLAGPTLLNPIQIRVRDKNHLADRLLRSLNPSRGSHLNPRVGDKLFPLEVSLWICLLRSKHAKFDGE
jgi:hypothetical protein